MKVIGLTNIPVGFQNRGRMEQLYSFPVTLYWTVVTRCLGIHTPV